MGKTFHDDCKASLLCKLAVIAFLLFPAMNVLQAGTISAKTVSGTVTSAVDGEPLIGASVQVLGTGTGAVTDLDGNYTVEANDDQILVFSYVGYITQKIKVGAKTNINVALEEDNQNLDDVVVIGYGVQKKKLITGANLSVKGENVAKMNTTNPLQALQGQTPGMTIISQSGQPGSEMKVNIRGMGTVSNSQPLYIIDGIRGDINSVNPNDIESIDVLKDGASAAIYGAQSANGVVLITTKSGKEGKAVVTFDGYVGWQNKPRDIHMLNAQEYMNILDEQAVNSGNAPYNWDKYKTIWNYDNDGNLIGPNNTDWVDQMFKDNAKTGSYNLGVSGGGQNTTYALSLGYMNQEGIVGGKDVSNYERYNFRVNSEWKVKKWLKVGEQMSYIYTKSKGLNVNSGAYNNVLRGAFGMSPLIPVYGDNDYDSPYLDTKKMDWEDVQTAGNPYGLMMTNTNNQTNAARVSINGYADAEIIKGLNFRTVLGYEYYSADYRSFTPIYKFSDYMQHINQTNVSQNASHNQQLTWTNTLTYNFDIAKEHHFTALLGTESWQLWGVGVGASQGMLRSGFDNWYYAYVSNGTASTPETGLGANGAPSINQRMFSYFGRLSWNWKETYMFNATLRADQSSKFAKGHRTGWFPSFSAGWIMSNEKWYSPIAKVVDYFKLRGSWGQTGNQNVGDLMFLSPITTSGVYYNFGNQYGAAAQSNYYGAYESRLANSELKWETSESLDFGFDARLFQKLNINFDWYSKKTKDWLVTAPILATAGTGAPYINGGDVKNTGIEIGLSWQDNIGKDFHYFANFNAAYNKNKVGNIPTEDGIIHGTNGNGQLYDNSTEFYRAQNGHPIGYFWGYKTAGIFQNKQEITDWITNGNGVLQSNPQPGDVKYYDINHDGHIDDNDKVDLGNGMPDWTFGFSLGFDYKGLDFSITANAMTGNKIVQTYRNVGVKTSNYTTEILDRWTGEGTSNKIPRVTESNINWQFSDLFIHDGDFLRISNITLGYDFARIIRQAWISQCRLYLQVQNAFTFTKYNGMDPEIGNGGVDSWVTGVDQGYYPRPRTFLVGLNLKF